MSEYEETVKKIERETQETIKSVMKQYEEVRKRVEQETEDAWRKYKKDVP